MKIKRTINGQEYEFELTGTELQLASEEYNNGCYEEDIVSRVRQKISHNFFFEGDLVKVSANEVLSELRLSGAELSRQLGKCDSYYEAFWDVVDNCIRDGMPTIDEINPDDIVIKKNNDEFKIYLNQEFVGKFEKSGILSITVLEPFLSDKNCGIIRDKVTGVNTL